MERQSSFLSQNQGILHTLQLVVVMMNGGDPGICYSSSYEDMSEECEPGGVS